MGDPKTGLFCTCGVPLSHKIHHTFRVRLVKLVMVRPGMADHRGPGSPMLHLCELHGQK